MCLETIDSSLSINIVDKLIWLYAITYGFIYC